MVSKKGKLPMDRSLFYEKEPEEKGTLLLRDNNEERVCYFVNKSVQKQLIILLLERVASTIQRNTDGAVKHSFKELPTQDRKMTSTVHFCNISP